MIQLIVGSYQANWGENEKGVRIVEPSSMFDKNETDRGEVGYSPF